jgi:hypothetical protein
MVKRLYRTKLHSPNKRLPDTRAVLRKNEHDQATSLTLYSVITSGFAAFFYAIVTENVAGDGPTLNYLIFGRERGGRKGKRKPCFKLKNRVNNSFFEEKMEYKKDYNPI